MEIKSSMSIGSRIKDVRVANHMTQKEFAQALGIVQGFLSGLERGKKMPSQTLLYALCHKFRVNESWLMDGTGPAPSGAPLAEGGDAPAPEGNIPLLERIPQGFPDQLDPTAIVASIRLPNVKNGCYAIIAEGEYMAPTIRDGDLVVFRPGEQVTNRSIVLISNRWGEVILRRCRMKGNETFFAPDNSIYAPFSPGIDTRIFGTVLHIWRKVRI